MPQHKPFSWKARLRSFTYAGRGIFTFFKKEHNARIHLAAAIAAVISGFIFHLNGTEWIAILSCIALVWIAEMINTCLEIAMDHFSPEYSESVKHIKDIAAGAVLVAALLALVTGCIIFLPKLY